jgi:hypothetical protein
MFLRLLGGCDLNFSDMVCRETLNRGRWNDETGSGNKAGRGAEISLLCLQKDQG